MNQNVNQAQCGIGNRVAILLAVLALAGLFASTARGAEGDRVLDPLLSLVGGCKEETLDPKEDPGCPETPPLAAHPPSGFFSDPRAVATDSYGNIYVSSFGKSESGSAGRIDIFDSHGVFISELKTPGPTSLAIDSEGYLYVVAQTEGMPILRFAPCPGYEPAIGKITYCEPPVKLPEVVNTFFTGLAINRSNDHLFANFGIGIAEYSSATEGNSKIRTTKDGAWGGGVGVAVDARRDRLYASIEEDRIVIFNLNSVVGVPPNDQYEKVGTIDGTEVPAGDFGTQLSVAVDEGTGHVFVLDGENTRLYEFDEGYKYLTTIAFAFQRVQAGEIGVDNGPFSPNQGYLYVPSHRTGVGHSFAFFESNVSAPVVKSPTAANITESETELRAQINPGNLDTSYTFEIKAEEANNWTLVGEGKIPATNLDTEATAVASGLREGTRYRFRIVATNEAGSDEAEESFATYPSLPVALIPCTNALLRTGPSALLPDCRAYELVTPPDTNGRAPLGTIRAPGSFLNRQVSPAGDKVPFRVEGGSLPGFEGTGSLRGDPYVSSRTPTGWMTAYIGPSGADATSIIPGTTSPDQGHSFWTAQVAGAAVSGESTSYVRYPDGHSEFVGRGSLGQDPNAVGRLISEGGDHIVFTTNLSTAVQLEPEAAPEGTAAIYDRTPDGTTDVISLKPNDVPLGPGEHAVFQGASLDGEGVAFEVGNSLYLRYKNEVTFEIGQGLEFAGVVEGGRRIFYVESGDLKAFDVGSGVKEFTTSGDVTPVQISADGTAAYFVSPSVLSALPNPNGAKAQAGKQNLYLSREGQISFVATVTDRDVEGEFIPGTEAVDGLGLWVGSIGNPLPGRLANVPSRTTPDGSVLLFKSRAALSDYDPEGYAQIYRYDSVARELQCLSCNPTGAAARSDATLQSGSREGSALFDSQAWLENLRPDGRRAFFESSEPLVARDGDGLQDVYEWEDQGVGSCTTPGGCVYLISSPQSLRNEYLWAISESGDDIFFLSSDRLVGADADETPSIYDARVGGGFGEPAKKVCVAEGCRPRMTPPPLLSGAEPHAAGPDGNVKGRFHRCGKGKRKVKRAGKVRCVKKKKHKQRQRRASSKQTRGRR
jgi:hypothetical protein